MKQRILSSIASRLGVKQSSTMTEGSSFHEDLNSSPVVENYNRHEILVDFPSSGRRRNHDEDDEDDHVDTPLSENYEDDYDDFPIHEEDERTLDTTDPDEKACADHEQTAQDHPFSRGFGFAQEPTGSTSTPSTMPHRSNAFPSITSETKRKTSKKMQYDDRQAICNSAGNLPDSGLLNTLMERRSSLPSIFEPTENELGAQNECLRKIMNDLDDHVPGGKQVLVLSAIQKIAVVMAEELKY
jgi:hypothetical protein